MIPETRLRIRIFLPVQALDPDYFSEQGSGSEENKLEPQPCSYILPFHPYTVMFSIIRVIIIELYINIAVSIIFFVEDLLSILYQDYILFFWSD